MKFIKYKFFNVAVHIKHAPFIRFASADGMVTGCRILTMPEVVFSYGEVFITPSSRDIFPLVLRWQSINISIGKARSFFLTGSQLPAEIRNLLVGDIIDWKVWIALNRTWIFLGNALPLQLCYLMSRAPEILGKFHSRFTPLELASSHRQHDYLTIVDKSHPSGGFNF